MKLITDASLDDRSELEKESDRELAEFDAWFQSKGNSPLVRSEKAIVKTFLYYLAHKA